MKTSRAVSIPVILRLTSVALIAGMLTSRAPAAPIRDVDDETEAASPPVNDPFIKINRLIFSFNDSLYRVAIRPASKGYETVVPRPVRRGFENFFDNIRFPVRFTGALLQAKVARATREVGRFVVNSVLGVGGVFHISDRFAALEAEPTEDIGQVFGYWGIGPGPYLVLPILGPSDARDLVGRLGDGVLTPTWWRFDHYRRWQTRLAVQSTDAIQSTPGILRSYDAFKVNAIDPYLGVRNAYLTHRASEIAR
jgi:phospholipid-binding lipoprotein MlaA